VVYDFDVVAVRVERIRAVVARVIVALAQPSFARLGAVALAGSASGRIISLIVRLSSYLSLALGIYAVLAVLSGWGAAAGLALGVIAVVCGWASLTERPDRRLTRIARVGVMSGALAIAGFFVWVLLALLGV
jgi:hypothetical protein